MTNPLEEFITNIEKIIPNEQLEFYYDSFMTIFGEQKNEIIKRISSSYNNLLFLEYIIKTFDGSKQINTASSINSMIIVSDNLEFFTILKEKSPNSIYILENWNKKLCENNEVQNYNDSLLLCNEGECSKYNECKIGKQYSQQKNYPILVMSKNKFKSLLHYINDKKIIEKYIDSSFQERNKIIIDGDIQLIENQKINISDINNFKNKIEKSNKIKDSEIKFQMYKVLDDLETKYLKNVEKFLKYEKLFVKLNETLSEYDAFKKEWISYFYYKELYKLELFENLFNSNTVWSRESNGNYFFVKKKYFLSIPNANIFILGNNSSIELKNKIVDDYIDIKSSQQEDIENITFHVAKENLSKTAIKDSKKPKSSSIIAWINQNIDKKTYLITYKEVQNSKFVEELNIGLKDNDYIIKNKENNIFHFGSKEHTTEFNECENLIYLGWNQYSSNNYIADTMLINQEVCDKYNHMYEKGDLIEIEKNLEFKYGGFQKFPEGQETLNNNLLEGLESELMKIRNVSNKKINVYFFSNDTNLRKFMKEKLKEKYKKSKFKSITLIGEDFFQEGQNKGLKAIFDYLEIWDGKNIAEAEILNDLGLSVSFKVKWQRFCKTDDGKELLKQKNIKRKQNKKNKRYYLYK